MDRRTHSEEEGEEEGGGNSNNEGGNSNNGGGGGSGVRVEIPQDLPGFTKNLLQFTKIHQDLLEFGKNLQDSKNLLRFSKIYVFYLI